MFSSEALCSQILIWLTPINSPHSLWMLPKLFKWRKQNFILILNVDIFAQLNNEYLRVMQTNLVMSGVTSIYLQMQAYKPERVQPSKPQTKVLRLKLTNPITFLCNMAILKHFSFDSAVSQQCLSTKNIQNDYSYNIYYAIWHI